MKRINLSIINEKQYKVLSGVELGETARNYFKLDEEDNNNETVTIEIPDDVYSVNSSFFSGAFQKSIRKLGEEKFREKYIFECDEVIKLNIENGIFNIVKTVDLLGGQS